MTIRKFSLVFLILILSILYCCQSPVPKNRLSHEEQAKLITSGKTITMLSFRAFSKELMKALNEGGVKHAVDYCQLQASPLIDSLSKVHRVKISRISDRFRNPANKPGEQDLVVINTYQKQLANGDELQPHLESRGDEVIFYSPILILNPVCLNCHGEPGSTLAQENFDFIKSRYPDDLAYGYKFGDLRGVWKIVLSPEF